jgi:amino acid transporter
MAGADPEGWQDHLLVLVVNVPMQFVVASACLFATSRYIYALSRGGLLPVTISLTYESAIGKRSPRELMDIDKGVSQASMIASRSTTSNVGNVSTSALTNHASGEGTSHDVKPSTNPRTPIFSVIFAAVVSFVFNIVVNYTVSGDDDAMDDLLRMSVWISCVCYALQMLAYLKIRYSMPTLPRTAKSPFGIIGAGLCLILTLTFGIIAPFATTSAAYIKSCVVLGIFTGSFLMYYYLYAKPRLTKSPEQMFIQYVFILTSKSHSFALQKKNLTIGN